jgi:hypothetical protein
MVDLLWHQWSSIGVAGYPRLGDDWIVDPEALLLATTRFGRHDSRLMDESIDWLAKFGRRISLQRLQGLHRSWPGVADRVSSLPSPKCSASRSPTANGASSLIPLRRLTRRNCSSSAIARSTGYFSKSIQQILNEMEESARAISVRHGLREALDEAMPALIRAGGSHKLRSSRDQRGAHLIQSLLADLDSLLG